MGICNCSTPRPGGCHACNDAMGAGPYAPQPFPVIDPRFVAPQGCICPPTSEQTCKNPHCPRGGGLPFRVT